MECAKAQFINGTQSILDIHEVIRRGQQNDLKDLIRIGKVDKTWHEADTNRNLLHLAAISNQVDIINFLLGECRFNINAQDSDGNTALHLAVISGHAEATGAILSYKPNDALCNKDHDPPLHIAIKQGVQGIKIVSEFVVNPTVNLCVNGNHNYSTLQVIAETDNLKALELMHLESEFILEPKETTVEDRNGLTAFHIAAKAGSHNVLAFMLSLIKEQGSSEEINRRCKDSMTPLHYAVEHGHVECVRVLLEYGGDPTETHCQISPSIHLACFFGRADIVKLMVDKYGVSILQARDEDGRSTLHSCTTSVFGKKVIDFLVKNGVYINNIDSNGCTSLSSAIQYGSLHTVQEILNYGGDPLIKDKQGYTALHQAVLSERIEVFKKIVASDAVHAMASTADFQGYYPIHHALKLGYNEMVVELLAATPEVLYDPHGNNYFHFAASCSEEQILEYLLSMQFAQSLLNETNSSGCTPLHYAALNSNIRVLKKLLDHGAVVHRDHNGRTPFMYACFSGNLATLKASFYKAKMFQKDVDHDKNTALHLAVDGKNPEVITFCLDLGISVTLNREGDSFFDKILNCNDQELARAAVSHQRWEECMDTFSSQKPHPILRILNQMPKVYQVILNQCYKRCKLDPLHPDYSEELNFKCVDLTLYEQFKSKASRDQTELTDLEQVHTQELKEDDKTKMKEFAVIKKLIEHKQVSYMRHPIVVEFIKYKWSSVGILNQLVITGLPFLLALFFSIGAVSMQQDLNSLVLTNLTNQTFGYKNLRPASQGLFIANLLLALFSHFFFVVEAYAEGFNIIFFFRELITVWTRLVASSCIIILLLGLLMLFGMLLQLVC